MELKLDWQDMDRVLACLAHAAHRFEEQAARQHKISQALVGHPLGMLGGAISEIIAELFTAEGQQLRQLHARLLQAINTSAGASTSTNTRAVPGEQKDGASSPSFE